MKRLFSAHSAGTHMGLARRANPLSSFAGGDGKQ